MFSWVWTDVCSLISAVNQHSFPYQTLRAVCLAFRINFGSNDVLWFDIPPNVRDLFVKTGRHSQTRGSPGNGGAARVTRFSRQTFSSASGSHLLAFDPCRNKHGRKTNVCRGRGGKSVFQHLSVNVTWQRDDFFFPGKRASSARPAVFSWGNFMRG